MSAANRIEVWHPEAMPGRVLYRGTEVTHPYPRHWHEELHLCAYSAGAGRLRLRGEARIVSAGELIITPAGEVHENWVETRQGCSFRSAYLPLALLEGVARELSGGRPPVFSRLEPRSQATARAFLRWHRAIEAGGPALRLEGEWVELCRALLRDCAEAAVSERRLGQERTAVRRARELLEEHLDGAVTLQQLAAHSGLSPFHLHRAFCREVGLPPHAFQIQARINRARQLLEARVPLAEVAALTGFADQSHLTRHFLRRVGVTPGRFAA